MIEQLKTLAENGNRSIIACLKSEYSSLENELNRDGVKYSPYLARDRVENEVKIISSTRLMGESFRAQIQFVETAFV